MRILIVTPWFPTGSAPVSGVFVLREAEALAQDHDVTVLHLDWQSGSAAPTPPAQFALSHVRLRRVRPADYLRARRLVLDAARDHDIVHTHALTGLVPWLIGRPAPLPWVHSEHWSALAAPETLARGARVALRLLRPLLRRPDTVVAESSRLATAIRPYRHDPVEIVPCVVRNSPVQDSMASGQLRLVGVGGLISRKGPDIALEALAELVRRGHDATLTWVGEGPLRDSLLAQARLLGVASRLRLTGALDDAGVSRELTAATMFVLPTLGDNFCIVTAEALAHGRPIVSGAATGAVDYADPRYSRFVAQHTGEAYASAIEDLVLATAAASSGEIANTVADRFTPSTVADALTRIYDDVTRGAVSRP